MIAVGARKRAVEALELFADLVAKEQEAASASSEQEDDSGTQNSESESSD
jgi:hypothetical protein